MKKVLIESGIICLNIICAAGFTSIIRTMGNTRKRKKVVDDTKDNLIKTINSILDKIGNPDDYFKLHTALESYNHMYNVGLETFGERLYNILGSKWKEIQSYKDKVEIRHLGKDAYCSWWVLEFLLRQGIHGESCLRECLKRLEDPYKTTQRYIDLDMRTIYEVDSIMDELDETMSK